MKVVFLSNYFTHHQKPFSDAMYKILGNDYCFVETSEMTEDRKSLGWKMNEIPNYVISSEYYENSKEKVIDSINEADVVVFGSAPEMLLEKRKKTGKLILRNNERPLRKGPEIFKYIPRFIKWHKNNPSSKPIYMLCSSAYTPSDYAMFGLFKGKCYKWGYFPEAKKYESIDNLISQKKKNTIMWCARFIELKHPEYAIELAKALKNQGYDFEINMIGSGVLEDEIKDKVRENGLEDFVKMHGVMKPEEVRVHMEKSEIFIFTSDKQEGWGAVLNESMNSGCAVVANNAIGSVPYLINDGVNGLVYYNDKNPNELIEKVKFLLDNAEKRRELSKKAYETIVNEWNAENAANKLVLLMERLLNGEKKANPFSEGVCSLDATKGK